MITFSKLGRHGQLGNQLFQYALLQAVAARRGYRVAIPKNYTGQKEKGLVELEPFSITADTLPAGFKPSVTYKEQGFPVAGNQAVFEQPDGADYEGYFQSEKYFKEIEPTIRQEFTFRPEYAGFADAYIAGIRATADGAPIVSVHNRRGDYLKNPHLFTVLAADWFERAMSQMTQELGPGVYGKLPIFLVFSDDQPWCAQHLAAEGRTLRFCGTPSHWHDMAVMARCDHHINSASTFSWWGAWLNTSPTKQVIVPDPWFQPAMNLDTRDIVPENWTKLPL